MTPSHTTRLADRTVLVVGPGWLGLPIAQQLEQVGARVFTMQRSVSRMPQADATTPVAGSGPPIVAIAGDITTAVDTAAVRAELPETIDHVVLCIAPTRSRGDTHGSSYPTAARGAVALAAALHARSVLYTSSTGVYGRTAGELVDEATALYPDDDRQQALVDAERVLWDGAARHGVGSIVLRLAGLYGPGRDPGRRFADPATIADGGETWTNFSWRDDVVDAVLHLLADPTFETGAHCFNCTDGHPMQAKAIARALGVDVEAVVRVLADTQRDATAISAPEIGANSGRARKSNQRISILRLLATGWSPRVLSVLDGLEKLGHRVTRPAVFA